MTGLPTITDVARIAAVSRQTVSNVLNTPDVVLPATRKRVEAAIAELGYRPHASARRLRTQKSSTIGIRLDPMTDGISGSVLDRFLHALTEKADNLGLRVLLFTATDPLDEIRQFGRLVDGADVDAFVLTSTFHGDPRTQWLIDHEQSFVTFGRPWGIDDLADPAHPWVDVDGRSGVRAATEQLLQSGRHRIAYIGWPQGSGTGDERRLGWIDAMNTGSGLTRKELEALRVDVEDGVTSGRIGYEKLLSQKTNVEAIVAASDALALGAVMASHGEIPVTGFDNTPIAVSIGFSSVEQPLREVAAGVLSLLTAPNRGDTSAHHVGDEPGARHLLIKPSLVVRSGTALS